MTSTPTVDPATSEHRRADFQRFSPDSLPALSELRAAVRRAEAEEQQREQELAQRIARVRSLLQKTVELHYTAQRGEELTSLVDEREQARAILTHYASPASTPQHWQGPLHFGGALLSLRPALLRAAKEFSGEATEAEKELRAAVKETAVDLRALAEEARRVDQQRAGVIDELLARLTGKGKAD